MPKLVNLVKRLHNRTDTADAPMLSIDTALPGSPILYTSCATPVRMITPRKRMGEMTPHGLQQWVPQIDQERGPDFCQGGAAVWLGGFNCPHNGPCNYFIAQPEDVAPLVNWSTTVIPCTPTSQPASARTTSPQAFLALNSFPYEALPWNAWAYDDPLAAGGSVVSLADGGSFSATFAVKCNFTGGSPDFQARLIDRTGKVLKQTDPFTNDGRACAANVGILPPMPNTIVNNNLRVEIVQRTPFVTTQVIAGVFFVEWTPT